MLAPVECGTWHLAGNTHIATIICRVMSDSVLVTLAWLHSLGEDYWVLIRTLELECWMDWQIWEGGVKKEKMPSRKEVRKMPVHLLFLTQDLLWNLWGCCPMDMRDALFKGYWAFQDGISKSIKPSTGHFWVQGPLPLYRSHAHDTSPVPHLHTARVKQVLLWARACQCSLFPSNLSSCLCPAWWGLGNIRGGEVILKLIENTSTWAPMVSSASQWVT